MNTETVLKIMLGWDIGTLVGVLIGAIIVLFWPWE